MRFPTPRAAILWAYEVLDCRLRASDPERDSVIFSGTSIGVGYLIALDIKIATDRVAHRSGCEDDRGNWLILEALSHDEPINFLDWQRRKIDTAFKDLSDILYRKGYVD